MPDSRQSAVAALSSLSPSSESNIPPVAVDNRASTVMGAPVLIDVLADDFDANGDPLQMTAFTMPAHGTVGLIAAGTMRYVPQAGFFGIDYFSYTISDGRRGQATAWVEVRVKPATNRPPLAMDDVVTTQRDAPVTFDVLANDSDPDGDPPRIIGFTMPAHGQLAVNGNQTITYTPDAGFVGDDSFSYSVSDGQGGTAQAEVTLAVTQPNTAPVAVGDRATTTQGAPVRIDILANDSDPDGDPLTLVALTVPMHGILDVNQDRSITYTPDAAFVGIDDFTYMISDGKGGRSSSVVVIEVVEAANQAPTAIVLDTLAVEENAPGAVVGRVTVVDPDGGDDHVLNVDDPRFEIVGAMLRLKDGVALDHESEPSLTLAITATDTGGLALTRSFTLGVVDVNEAPTAITLDNLTVAENAPGALVGRLAASDPDAGDNHSYTVDDPRFEIAGGTLRLKNGVALDHESEPSPTLAITATDTGGLALTRSFAISVVDINEAPTAIVLDTLTVEENAPGAVVGRLTVVDPDGGDDHVLNVDDPRFEIVGDMLRLKNGVALDHESEPSLTLAITATDTGGLALTRSFAISVVDVNEAPTAITLDNLTVAENAPGALVGRLAASDPDAGDNHSYTVDDPRFVVLGDELRLKNGVALDHESEPSLTLAITATDTGGLALTQSFTISVVDVNEAPTAIVLDTLVVEENAPGAVVGRLTVVDPDAGDNHSYTVDDPRFEIVGDMLRLKNRETLDHESEPSVTLAITATDTGGLALTQSFTISVIDVNEAPTAIVLDTLAVEENAPGAVVGRLTVVDPDGGDRHALNVDDPRFVALGDELRLKNGVALDHESEPSLTLAITATDTGGLALTQSFTLSVIDVNEAPAAITLDTLAVEENAPGAVVGRLTVVDPDGDDYHVLNVDDPRFEIVGAMLKLKNGVTLDYESEPSVTLAITATDTGGLALTRSFTISVVERPITPARPVAVADFAVTVANRAVATPVLANDSDPAGRPLSVVAVTRPSAGTAVILEGGIVDYTPAFGFIGQDSFNYTVANDLGFGDEALVTVDVEGNGEPFSDGTFFTDGTGFARGADFGPLHHPV